MKALITGAGGFVGSHLVEHLLAHGHEVRAMVHYSGDGRRGWLEDEPELLDDVQVVAGDIRDTEFVARSAKDCDVIFNLAAQAGLTYSFEAPRHVFEVNATGCLNVLEAARRRGARVVQMSTSEVYGSAQSASMDEMHPVSPQSPYAASKVAAEALCLAYQRSYGLDVRIARCFNIYGPRQSMRALIPAIMGQILRSTERPAVVKLATLTASRDYTYVTDTVEALRLIGEVDATVECDCPPGPHVGHPDRYPGLHAGHPDRYQQVHVLNRWPTNVGSGEAIEFRKLVDLCALALGLNTFVSMCEDMDQSRPGTSEVQRLVCDRTNIAAVLGWSPAVDLADGLRRVAEWLRPRIATERAGRVV